MQIPHETQNGLDTFEPDQMSSNVQMLGQGGAKTYFIPCRDTLRWWRGNSYNLNLRAEPVVVDPKFPMLEARVDIGIYLAVAPTVPLPSAGIIFGRLIPPSYYSITGPIIIINNVVVPEMLELGGSHWIAIRMATNASPGNPNLVTFTFDGWTLADNNLPAALLMDTVSTGALPSTYVSGAAVALTGSYPYIRIDYV